MTRQITRHSRAIYGVPNGIQVTDEGIWVVDQLTDRLALIENTEPNVWGVAKIIREFATDSSTTSGIAWGEDVMWMAANGPGDRWRPPRETDATTGEILKVDPQDGRTLARYPLPGGGGTHGIEYDHFDPGHVWLTTLQQQTLTLVRSDDWSIVRTVPLPYGAGHGVVRVEDGLWMVFKEDRLICKLDPSDGSVLDQVEIGPEHPEPHGLSIFGDNLLYCDATSGWIVEVSL